MTDSTSAPALPPGEASRGTTEVQKYRPRACICCAKSKMRCVWPGEPGTTRCERCERLNMQCSLPELNPRKRRGPSTRVGELETKIDGIMSLLNASKQVQQNSLGSGGQSTTSDIVQGAASRVGQGRNSIHQTLNPTVNSDAVANAAGKKNFDTPLSSSYFPPPARLSPPAGRYSPPPTTIEPGSTLPAVTSPFAQLLMNPRHTATSDSIEIVKDFRVSFNETERNLDLFRDVYSLYFPFVIVPSTVASSELYKRTPFLFRTIIATTTPQSPNVQNTYKLWFREFVAQHVVVDNEKRLEILQAILIYLAWGDFHFMVDSQATNLIQLANALVIDLGLNRKPLDYGKANFLMLKESSAAKHIEKNAWKREHSHDELRAALGTFYITSLCSTLFRRHAPMVLSPYLHKSCQTLADAEGFASDKLLVALVRIQQLLNRVADIIPYGDDNPESPIQYTSTHMALTAAHNELERLTQREPDGVGGNVLYKLHYHGTICRLFEPVIYIRHTPGIGCYQVSDGVARTTALETCLYAARDFFLTFVTIAAQDLTCVPFHSAHLSFCTATVVRLLFLSDDPDWNPVAAREAIKFEQLLTSVADLFELADRSCAATERRARYFNGDRTVLSTYRDKVLWIREWYANRTRASVARSGPQQHVQAYHRGGSWTSGKGKEVADSGVDASTMNFDFNSLQAQDALLSEHMLDEGFWQAMSDWSWNVPMSFQAEMQS